MANGGFEELTVSRLARGATANALAAVVASVAGLAIVLLAGRSMTPAEYATFASVWGLVFGCAAIVGALEQENARVRASVRGPIDRTQLAATGVVSFVATLLMTLVVIFVFDDLHLRSAGVAALVVASAAIFPTMFTVRGFLAGSLRFEALAAVTAGEALLRLGVVVLALWAGLATVPVFAAAASCGALVGLPVLLRSSTLSAGTQPLGGFLRRTWTLMLGNAMSAILVTGAPVLVGLAMAGLEVGEIGQTQAAVVVSRFPLIALMLLQGLLVPVFVRRASLHSDHDYRIVLALLILAIPAAAMLSFAGGSWLLAALYGPEYQIGHVEIALLTTGATALGGIQVLVALAVSGDRHRLAPVAFAPTLVVTALLAFLSIVPVQMRVPLALAVGPLTGFVVAILATARWRADGREPVRNR
jgi:O-antigen/teichoic acid export membrane protein